MTYLVVTPARNEAARLPALARSLAAQEPGLVGLWVVVDDGSTDGTAECLPTDLPFPVEVVRRENEGGLSGGSAFGAWRHGAEHGLRRLPEATRVLKVDADLELHPGHLEALARVPLEIGLVGGVLVSSGEVPTRADHTRGALKAYNRPAYDLVGALPVAVGFDVLDEVAVREAGLGVQVVPAARATLTRVTGTSEGLLRGRRRGGLVSRWTGYSPLYFAVRVVRMLGYRPYLTGSAAMLLGYVTAGPGPWPAELKRAHRRDQHDRLRRLLRSPVRESRAYRERS